MDVKRTTVVPAAARCGECCRCGPTYGLTDRGRLDRHDGMTPSGASMGKRCSGVGLPPFFVEDAR